MSGNEIPNRCLAFISIVILQYNIVINTWTVKIQKPPQKRNSISTIEYYNLVSKTVNSIEIWNMLTAWCWALSTIICYMEIQCYFSIATWNININIITEYVKDRAVITQYTRVETLTIIVLRYKQCIEIQTMYWDTTVGGLSEKCEWIYMYTYIMYVLLK